MGSAGVCLFVTLLILTLVIYIQPYSKYQHSPPSGYQRRYYSLSNKRPITLGHQPPPTHPHYQPARLSSSHGNYNSYHGNRLYNGNQDRNRRYSESKNKRYSKGFNYNSNRNYHSSHHQQAPIIHSNGLYSRRNPLTRKRYSHKLNVYSSSHQYTSKRRIGSAPSRVSQSSSLYQPYSSYLKGVSAHHRDRQGYYQASYDLGKNDFYLYEYPTIPTYNNHAYSHDTSPYYDFKTSKVACYQCNYKPGRPTYKLVTIYKSVPDPYYPFHYMNIKTKEYVRNETVSSGWDKCQGTLSQTKAKEHGVYQQASCEGNCYVRVDSNKMVYRGCYSGEWAVNPHIYGCSYQAGSLYCFCRGDRCNGFQPPNSYSDPYPFGYASRGQHPYPADYPHSMHYNPYPRLQTYHQSHPISVKNHNTHRYRRDTRENNTMEQILITSQKKLYKRMLGEGTSNISRAEGNTAEDILRRSCYLCDGAGCSRFFQHHEASAVKTMINSYGNCYVKLHTNNSVSRGAYTGENGVNQHLIGCHIQGDVTYCFCHGSYCNNFAVTIETPEHITTNKTSVLTNDAANGTVNTKANDTKDDQHVMMVLYYIQYPGK